MREIAKETNTRAKHEGLGAGGEQNDRKQRAVTSLFGQIATNCDLMYQYLHNFLICYFC